VIIELTQEELDNILGAMWFRENEDLYHRYDGIFTDPLEADRRDAALRQKLQDALDILLTK
jgi:hypothetical protein